MAVTVTHPFVSAIPDGIDTTLVRPSNWNATHSITGSIGTVTVTGGATAYPNGAVAYGVIGPVNVWGLVDDTQTPVWDIIPDTQTPTWASVLTPQTPAWAVISDTQTPTWAPVLTPQTPNWQQIAA